jgi:hypothetical protein
MGREKILKALIGLLASSALHAQPSLTLVDPLEVLYPDSNSLSGYGDRYEAHFPLGTLADVHLLLRIPPDDTVTVSASADGTVLGHRCFSRLVDVPVEQNTGLDSRTEMFTGAHNPFVIRRAPFRIYEAIEPLVDGIVVPRNALTALRLEVPAASLTLPGRHMIRIEARGRGWTLHGMFTAVVHRASVPPLAEGKFFYTNWFSLSQMEEKHALERWSGAWYAMLEKYAAMMAHGRQNCIIIPSELITVQEGHIVLDEERMGRFVELFQRHGFTYFESPHLMYRGDSDDWGDPELKVALTKRRYFTPEARRDVDTIVTLLREFTAHYGLTRNWLQHISDEPTAVQAACYRAVVQQVRSIYPEITIMEATSDRDTLAGAVDLWCPTIDDFQKNEAFFRRRQMAQEKVLVYTCLIPGGKWLNRLLDQERLRQVYFGWGAVRYNTFGYLHWGLNQYCTGDPFNQSVVHHPSPIAGANNFLPAGDTHIIYPGRDGPLSSTRFEAFRTGIEDYELLRLLMQKESRTAQELIESVFRDYTDYSTDVRLYRKARQRLLEAL